MLRVLQWCTAQRVTDNVASTQRQVTFATVCSLGASVDSQMAAQKRARFGALIESAQPLQMVPLF